MLCMIIAIVLDDNLTDMAINSYQYICQIFPTLMYAAFSKNKNTRVAFFAMGSGFLVTVVLEISAISLIMTSGVWGLIVNSIIIICAIVSPLREKGHTCDKITSQFKVKIPKNRCKYNADPLAWYLLFIAANDI